MKFRGKTDDITNIHFLTKILGTISRLTKGCVLRLTPEKLYLIAIEHSVIGDAGMWCEIYQGNVFDEYLMEGVNVQTANEIYLNVNPENLLRCLKCSQNAKSLKLKLARKGVPCLTVEVEQPTALGSSRRVTHDVAIGLVERKNWSDFNEPHLPDFDVSIYMPPLKIVKNIVDRMKNLSDHIMLAANHVGEMLFKIEKDVVTVTTHFDGLSYPFSNTISSRPQQHSGSNTDEFIEVRVDIKKLSHLLSGQQMNPAKVICSIISDQLVQILFLNDGVSLQYIIPSSST